MCDYCEGCLLISWICEERVLQVQSKWLFYAGKNNKMNFQIPEKTGIWSLEQRHHECEKQIQGSMVRETHCSPCSKKAEEAESLPTTTTLGKHQCKEQLPCFPPWNSKQVLRKSLCAEDFLSWQRTAPRWLVIEKMVVVPTWLVRMI